MDVVFRSVALGMLVMLAGTLPRNIAFAANLRVLPTVPWAVPVVAIYLWFFWRYLDGAGGHDTNWHQRHESLRANPVPLHLWPWALAAGGLGIVALVFWLQVANRLVVLPVQQLPDLSHVPALTIWSLLLAAAPVAALVEEAAFRGYMQGPIERRYGLAVAIAITGTMFALAHLDFTLALWPYYLAVAAIYGLVTSLTGSVWPAVALHTAGNLYSNLDLLLHGRAEWQAPSGGMALVWSSGMDAPLLQTLVAALIVTVVSAALFARLARVARAQSPFL